MKLYLSRGRRASWGASSRKQCPSSLMNSLTVAVVILFKVRVTANLRTQRERRLLYRRSRWRSILVIISLVAGKRSVLPDRRYMMGRGAEVCCCRSTLIVVLVVGVRGIWVVLCEASFTVLVVQVKCIVVFWVGADGG